MEHATESLGCDPINLSNNNLLEINITDKEALYTVEFIEFDELITQISPESEVTLENSFYGITVEVKTVGSN